MPEHKGFPGFENVFAIHDPLGNRPFRGTYHPYELALPLSRGEISTTEAVQATWGMGSGMPSDVIWCTGAAPLIFHARIIDIFQSNNFTGWRTYPVEVRSKDGNVVPDFYGLTVIGRCGSIELSKSPIVLEKRPGGWCPQFLGHYFDPATWDGSDFFMEAADPRGRVPSRRFITEPVWRCLKRAKVRNLMFCPLSEERMETFIYEDLPANYEERLAEAYKQAGVPRPDFV